MEALQGEVEALERQLTEEAELASATLDRAEAAERELAALRARLDERQACSKGLHIAVERTGRASPSARPKQTVRNVQLEMLQIR